MSARTPAYVFDRLDALRNANSPLMNDRWRIRQIMNGGADGIRAIMAWDQGKGTSGRLAPDLGYDLPAANMMASGVERLAQRVGVPPNLNMPYGPRDSDSARKASELRERIVEGWDEMSRVPMQYPQIGRWLPGYAFTAQVIRPRVNPVTKQLWPHVELRDSYDTWPGYFGVGQHPHEIAFRRQVPAQAMASAYPDYNWEKFTGSRSRNRSLPPNLRNLSVEARIAIDSSWEGTGGGVVVMEYYDSTGTYVCVPEFELVIDYAPNILETGPMFVTGKRFAFDRLVSQYHHVIGLVGMMAKLNVLGLISAEDSTFRETNIVGEMEGNTYERGRGAINFFTSGTQVSRPTGDNNAQLWNQIDRLERQLRIGANYAEGADALPQRGGFITGQGQRELRAPADDNVDEYHLVIADAMEALDTRRLEWEEKHERSKRKRVFWIEGDRQTEETYVPKKDIGGNWRSRREYGFMAAWDESGKIVGGLQLVGARVIDIGTFRENLKGVRNAAVIEERLNRDRALEDLFTGLEQRLAEGDPQAFMVLTEIAARPDQTMKILTKFFTPKGEMPSPEEMAMAGMAPPGEAPEMQMGPPPSVQTVLSELATTGANRGGAQTVTVNRR